MEMSVDGQASLEVVMGESHAGRVKIASIPAGQTLNDFEGAGIYEWHQSSPGRAILALKQRGRGLGSVLVVLSQ